MCQGAVVSQRKKTGCARHNVLFALGVLGAIAMAVPALAHDTVYYFMTDALHSTVVVTDQNRNIVEETHYGPYGLVLNRQLRDGPGYAGHEEDPATGLVYMQQRYYDPQAGRFLSVDPVGVEPASGGNFNRYWYAKDNPYRYTDPDGRCSDAGGGCSAMVAAYAASPEAQTSTSGLSSAQVKVAGAVLAIDAGAEEVAGPALFTAAVRYAGAKIASAVTRRAASRDVRPNGVPKNWAADKPSKGPGTIYRNPENPAHDTVRVVPGRSESSQSGQQVDHVVRTANGHRYGADNTPVPTKSQASHIPVDKFKFVPADKLPTH